MQKNHEVIKSIHSLWKYRTANWPKKILKMKNHIRTLKYFLIFTLLFSFYGCGSTGEKTKTQRKNPMLFFFWLTI